MAGLNSTISEAGLIKNTIKKGVGMSFKSVIFEKVDNSIDAGAKNITITLEKFKFNVKVNSKKKHIDSYALIVSDDGIGMSEENGSLQSLLSLFKINENNRKNGIFGIGSIASDLAVGDKPSDKITMYFTKSPDNDDDIELVIPWGDIFLDKSDNVWSNKISTNNISTINKQIFERYKINDKQGTVVINIFNEEYLDKINFQELYYNLRKTYYSDSLLNLNFKINDKLDKKEYKINKKNTIDVLSLEKIKKDKNLGCYIKSTINTYYHHDKKQYAFKIIINDYQLGETIINKNFIKYLIPISCTQNPKEFSDEENLEEWELYGKFNFLITLVTADIVNFDGNLMKEHLDRSDVSEYTGLYLERNNRILNNPIPLWHLRNTQSGNYWRCKLSWSNNKKLDDLIRPQLNKSQINTEDINKTLYRAMSLFVKEFYNKSEFSFYDFVIQNKNKCSSWNLYENQENKKDFNKTNKKTSKSKEIIKNDVVKNNSDKRNINKELKIIKNVCRKSFNPKQENSTLLKQGARCKILDVKLDQVYMPYDKDHKDGNSSNNNTDNLQLLSLITHRHKTHNEDVFKKMNDNKGIFIANMINCLSSSKYFKELYNSGKIKISGGNITEDGIFKLN